MCIVPSEGNYERFCHEFKVRSENGEYALIYINAENGREENVLILIQNENGTLVM